MAEYTPGPWKIGKGIAFSQSIYAGLVNVAFARQDHGRIDASTAEANARLIAAAPELLEALQWIAANYENGHMNHVQFRVEAKHRADAAIAKATDGEG